MPPTLAIIDGFEHQDVRVANFSSPEFGLWESANGTKTFPAGRTGGVCISANAAGAPNNIAKRFTDSQVVVFSVYYRRTSGGATIGTVLFVTDTAFSSVCRVYDQSDGTLGVQIGGGVTSSSFALSSNVWYRLDFRCDTSTTTTVIDWQIDGVAQTQVTQVVSIRSSRFFNILLSDATPTGTVQLDDLVVSYQSGDYPLGDHTVIGLLPTGDGTHNVSATAELKDGPGGADIDSVSAFALVDDWPLDATGTTFIQQTIADATKYAEVTFADTSVTSNIWGVEAIGALYSSGLSANNGVTRIVDSGGSTLVDVYSGTMNDTGRNTRRIIVPAPGGSWDQSEVNGLKCRVGFSSDVVDIPRWESVLLQMAYGPSTGPPPRKLHVVVSPERW
jgi:hypothetical protein